MLLLTPFQLLTKQRRLKMYRYYVHNMTRGTYCLIESKDNLEIGQVVLVLFDNEDLKGHACECKVLRKMHGLES